VIAAAILIAVTQAGTPPPFRHLVYNFTYTNSSDQTHHDSGIVNQGDALRHNAVVLPSTGGAAGSTSSGVSNYTNSVNDQGTIVVNVTRIQPDGGLVVAVSEQATGPRAALPATCVVYGNTTVVCDSSKLVNAEELALLRLLGSNFIDPAQIDAKNHWRVDQSSASESDVADFSIGKNDGTTMNITSQRVYKTTGIGLGTTTTNATIVYDFPRALPTSVVEDQVTRQNGTAGDYTTVRTQTSMALVEDSLAKKAAP
jgi:hypothetical protein